MVWRRNYVIKIMASQGDEPKIGFDRNMGNVKEDWESWQRRVQKQILEDQQGRLRRWCSVLLTMTGLLALKSRSPA